MSDNEDKLAPEIEVKPRVKLEGSQGGQTTGVKMTGESQAVIIQRKNITKLTGIPGSGIDLEHWLRSIEVSCKAQGITTDQDIIKEARDHVNFDQGPARKAIRRTNFESWAEFKSHLRVWLQVKPPQPHLDLFHFFNARWKPNEKFIDYIDGLRDLLERLISLKLDSAEEKKMYYKYMESAIVAQLPEEVRKDFLEKELKVKDEEGFEKFITEIQVALARNGKTTTKPVLAIEAKDRSNVRGKMNIATREYTRSADQNRTTNIQNRNENMQRQRPEERRQMGRSMSQPTTRGYGVAPPSRPTPTTWEIRNGVCGRCLNKNHYRAICTSRQVKCSLCGDNRHEYFECRDRQRDRPNRRF